MKGYEKIILTGMAIRIIGEAIGLYYKVTSLIKEDENNVNN